MRTRTWPVVCRVVLPPLLLLVAQLHQRAGLHLRMPSATWANPSLIESQAADRRAQAG